MKLLTNKKRDVDCACAQKSYMAETLAFGFAKYQNLILLLLAVIGVCAAVVVDTHYFTTLLLNCCLYGVLALSLNLISGYMGITSLGHAAFYGIGAYTAAILSTRFGVNFLLTFVAAFIVTGIVAFLLGLPTLKATGRHLAIITLGFCEIVRIVEFNWMSLTRGPMGISGIPSFSLFGIKLNTPLLKLLIALTLLALVYYVSTAIINSRLGRAMVAIRDNEIAAEAMGINIFRYKLLIFTLSAALAGIAGAFYAHHITFVDPKAFSFDQSILILSMVILGGMGSASGCILGAIILSIVPELLRGFYDFRLIVYGLVIVLMMILKPNGMLGGFNPRYVLQRHKNAAATRKEGIPQ